MTEQEWLVSSDSKPMLTWLKSTGSNRKLRLFMVALLRIEFAATKSIPHWVRQSVEVAEEMADSGQIPKQSPGKKLLHLCDNPHYAAVFTAKVAAERRGKARVSRQTQADFLREIFGNPFCPAQVHPQWLSWNGGTVRQLAEAIYTDRAFDRMPILADALEDAGCTDADILDHLRGPGPHVRGCWVVDMLYPHYR